MKILLAKLEQFCVRGVCLKRFESYIKERWQCFQVNDVLSRFLQLLVGVPQSTILGVLLFLKHITDLISTRGNPN